MTALSKNDYIITTYQLSDISQLESSIGRCKKNLKEGTLLEVSRKLLSVKDEQNYISVKTNAAQFRIYFLDENIIRIRTTFKQIFGEDCSYALVKTCWDDVTDKLMKTERSRVEPIEHTLEKKDHYFIASSKKYDIKIYDDPFYYEISDKDGNVLHKDLPRRSFVKDRLGRQYHYSTMSNHDMFYGFGEKAGNLNKYKYRMRMHNTDAIGWNAEKSDPLYKMIPFYIDFNSEANKASGVFYNNSHDSVFDMNCEHSSYWKERFSYFQCDGGELDFFFIGGPTIKDVVEHYTDLTGKTTMQPISSLGYMGSTMYYTELEENSDKAIIKFVDTCKKLGIPCDGFFLSSGYTSLGKKRYVFNWNKKRFPNPQEFVQELEKKGVLLSPNIKPGMLLTHPRLEEFKTNDAYVKNSDNTDFEVDQYWGGPAHFVDFTSKSGRESWAKAMDESLLSLGISSIWNDNNEYEINDDDAVVSLEGKGGTIGDVKPVMPTLMAKVARNTIAKRNPDVRPYITSRAGYAGIQRYAQTWAGDNRTSWKNLKFNVPTILGMGLSGVANQGCDIGGFDGPSPEPELFVRWVQNGIFQPRFTIHSCNDDNTVTEPWMYPSYTKYIREAIQLRYKLVPYFYSLLWESATKGSPIMRPLVYEFQEDPKVSEESFEFMLGSSLLVANILEKGITEKEIYLPSGTSWVELKSMKRYEGGQMIKVSVDMASIPMFLRAGGIIPTAPGLTNIHNDEIKKLDFLIDPTEDSKFTLFEDDGVTNNYQHGDYLETTFNISNITNSDEKLTEIEVRKEGDFVSKVESLNLSIVCKDVAPMQIKLDDQIISECLDLDDFENISNGWFYDDENKLAKIKLVKPSSELFKLKVTFMAKDLLIV